MKTRTLTFAVVLLASVAVLAEDTRMSQRGRHNDTAGTGSTPSAEGQSEPLDEFMTVVEDPFLRPGHVVHEWGTAVHFLGMLFEGGLYEQNDDIRYIFGRFYFKGVVYPDIQAEVGFGARSIE